MKCPPKRVRRFSWILYSRTFLRKGNGEFPLFFGQILNQVDDCPNIAQCASCDNDIDLGGTLKEQRSLTGMKGMEGMGRRSKEILQG
jgi:hypothetical protein